MPAPVGKCKLCQRQRALCKSHIVPEFAYKPIKNDNNQMLAVGHKVRTIQTGHFEHLLCRDCENLLSRYETKFKEAWMDTIPSSFENTVTTPPNDAISVPLPDYDSFKLFHLSVLWRAAISTRFKASRDISLGPYERILAEMILNGDPGQLGDFPFLASLNLDKQQRPLPTVAPLSKGKGRFKGRYHYYTMTYAFCDWNFFIARPGPKCFRDVEKRWREQGLFVVFAVPFERIKSLNLSSKVIRGSRE